ncbi:hypothetical protein TNCV_3703561 [Trichonephila clavipes]|nr:hypothetical protein TNCV_3703561 [Trichonephila clavipes]
MHRVSHHIVPRIYSTLANVQWHPNNLRTASVIVIKMVAKYSKVSMCYQKGCLQYHPVDKYGVIVLISKTVGGKIRDAMTSIRNAWTYSQRFLPTSYGWMRHALQTLGNTVQQLAKEIERQISRFIVVRHMYKGGVFNCGPEYCIPSTGAQRQHRLK